MMQVEPGNSWLLYSPVRKWSLIVESITDGPQVYPGTTLKSHG
jgi:hypothetical protein